MYSVPIIRTSLLLLLLISVVNENGEEHTNTLRAENTFLELRNSCKSY
jgi:hypothetical protein